MLYLAGIQVQELKRRTCKAARRRLRGVPRAVSRGDRQAAGAQVTEKNPPRIGRATARRQGGRKAAVARESREQQHSKPPPTLTDAQEERRFDASDAEERLQQATRAMAHVHAATQSVQRERSAKASTTALPWCVCVAAGVHHGGAHQRSHQHATALQCDCRGRARGRRCLMCRKTVSAARRPCIWLTAARC